MTGELVTHSVLGTYRRLATDGGIGKARPAKLRRGDVVGDVDGRPAYVVVSDAVERADDVVVTVQWVDGGMATRSWPADLGGEPVVVLVGRVVPDARSADDAAKDLRAL